MKSKINVAVLLCVSVCLFFCFCFPRLAFGGARAQIKLEQAKVRFSDQGYEEALALVEEVIQEEPDNAEAHHYAGLCQMGLGNAGRAVNYLQQAAELEPEDAGVWEDLCWAQLQAGMAEDALASAEAVLELAPGSERAMLYKGKALMGQRRYSEALPVLEGLFVSDEYGQAGYYYAGVCLIHVGKTQEARGFFERARDIDPDTDLGRRSGSYASTLGGEKPAAKAGKKPWGGRVRLLYQYDNNIALVHEEDLLPEDITDMDDSRGVLDLLGHYRYISGRTEAMVRYLGYSSWHSREQEVNIMYHLGEAGAFYKASAAGTGIMFGARGSYSGSWVEDESYSNVWKGLPEVSISWTEALRTRIRGEYSGEVFEEPGEGEDNRDNNKVYASLYQHLFLLDNRVNTWLGYSWGQVTAEGKNYNRVENVFHAGVISMLPRDIMVSVSGRYESRDYVDNAFDREEKRTFVSSSLQVPVYKQLHVYGGVSYGTVDANLEGLEYDRSIYSAGMLAQF